MLEGLAQPGWCECWLDRKLRRLSVSNLGLCGDCSVWTVLGVLAEMQLCCLISELFGRVQWEADSTWGGWLTNYVPLGRIRIRNRAAELRSEYMTVVLGSA